MQRKYEKENINSTHTRWILKFIEKINTNQGFIKTMWCGSQECEDKIKEQTGAHARCIPFKQECVGEKCVVCGKPADTFIIWGRQY